MGSCPNGEMSWWGVVLVESCPDTRCINRINKLQFEKSRSFKSQFSLLMHKRIQDFEIGHHECELVKREVSFGRDPVLSALEALGF